MSAEPIPVLIAGGGPVGLALAIELGRAGIGCLLVERRDGIEHLVLLGIGNDVVIETGIAASSNTPEPEFGSLLPGAPR
jgi:2-polyprenyl-6-methoxyphenol hydroxylase-like FAD-dependent oxidoreductase